LGEYSEPQPDLALLKLNPDFYAREHPSPADVLLVVEVMDSSASYDREVKVPLYARFAIPETWLVDVAQGSIEVYRALGPEGYRQVRTLRRGMRLSPQAFPELIVTVDKLLRRTGVMAMPVVAGQAILPEAASRARELQVWQLTDGQAVTPES